MRETEGYPGGTEDPAISSQRDIKLC